MLAQEASIDLAPDDSRAAASGPSFQPLTKGQVNYTAVVALLAWTFSVYDLITFGNILPAIQKDFGWANDTASYVATLAGLGSLLVALVVGPMIDLLGRRFALQVTTGGAAISSALSALAFGPAMLVVVRSLAGFGMSEQAVNSAYLNEILGPKNKGVIYGIVQAGWPLGVMLSSGLAAVLAPSLGWRGVFAVAAFPLIVMFVLRFGLKESPYFLKTRHLRELQAAGLDAEAAKLGKSWQLDLPKKTRNTYAELFSPALRKHTIAIAAMFFFKIIADSQMTVLGTSVLAQTKGVTLTSALWTVFIGNGVALFGYLALGWCGDRFGRRGTVIVAQAMAAVCTALLLFVAQGFTSVVVFYSLVLFFAQGAASPFFAYIGESYPTHIRGSGAALVNVAGPVGGIFGPLVYGVLQSNGFSPTMAAASGALAALLAAVCMIGARSIQPGQKLEAVSH